MSALARREKWTLTERFFFAAFLFWSAAGLIFTLARITPVAVGRWPIPTLLRDFVDLCLLVGDPVLILLAFINTHLHAARQWNGDGARRWAVLLVVCAFAIETCGAIFHLPFGDYHYTDRFGPVLYVVPLTIPLAWHVIVTNALFIVRSFTPHISRLHEAVYVGLFCMVYDIVLEPFATTVKGYWLWADKSVPIINYLAWFVLSALLVRLLAPTLSNRYRSDVRPVVIVGLTIMIFVAGESVSWIYR